MQISVVIPLYNKRASVLMTLQSVFVQIYQPVEILIINDGSTDGSEKLVEDLNHPLIQLIHQTNSGVSAARNKGIEMAKGEWIAFLDADDEWKPEYLKTIFDLHKTYPKANVLATSYDIQDYSGHIEPVILRKIPFDNQHGIIGNYFEIASHSHPPLWTSAVVVQKEALNAVDGFPIGIRSGEDLITWAKLALNNEIAYSLKRESIFIMEASHLLTSTPKREDDEVDYVGDELKKMITEENLIKHVGLKKYLAHWYKMKASVYLRANNKQGAIKYSIKSLKYNLFNYKVVGFLLLSITPNTIVKKLIRLYAS